jgi:signal peptidase II
MFNRRMALISAVLVMFFDLGSKNWIMRHFLVGADQPITSWFSLVYARNTGAAFSLLANQPGWQRGFFTAVALGASIIILILLRKKNFSLLASIGLGLILGGALGNAVDRMALGYVVDFLWFHVQQYSWPAFNVADSAIDLGAALLLWDNFHQSKTHKN